MNPRVDSGQRPWRGSNSCRGLFQFAKPAGSWTGSSDGFAPRRRDEICLRCLVRRKATRPRFQRDPFARMWPSTPAGRQHLAWRCRTCCLRANRNSQPLQCLTFRGSIPHPVQSLCTLRNHCHQWPRNTRYQADATPYLGRTHMRRPVSRRRFGGPGERDSGLARSIQAAPSHRMPSLGNGWSAWPRVSENPRPNWICSTRLQQSSAPGHYWLWRTQCFSRRTSIGLSYAADGG